MMIREAKDHKEALDFLQRISWIKKMRKRTSYSIREEETTLRKGSALHQRLCQALVAYLCHLKNVALSTHVNIQEGIHLSRIQPHLCARISRLFLPDGEGNLIKLCLSNKFSTNNPQHQDRIRTINLALVLNRLHLVSLEEDKRASQQNSLNQVPHSSLINP